MTPTANLDPQAPQGSWFSRNWKWLVPAGCLVPMMCCGVFGIGTYLAATKMIQGSPAFAEAFSRASQNPEVIDALGSPIAPGFGLSGEVKETNGKGRADFSIPLTGSKGEGTMHVVASSSGGVWDFQTIEVQAGGKTIDVLGSVTDPEPLVPEDEEQEPEEPAGD